MRNTQLVHPTVNRLPCLLKRTRKEFQMIILTVVVCHSAVLLFDKEDDAA
jgi:hypothetical protein